MRGSPRFVKADRERSKVMNTSARAKLRSIHSRCSPYGPRGRAGVRRQSRWTTRWPRPRRPPCPAADVEERGDHQPPALVIQVARTYVRPIARCTRGLLLSSRDATSAGGRRRRERRCRSGHGERKGRRGPTAREPAIPARESISRIAVYTPNPAYSAQTATPAQPRSGPSVRTRDGPERSIGGFR